MNKIELFIRYDLMDYDRENIGGKILDISKFTDRLCYLPEISVAWPVV